MVASFALNTLIPCMTMAETVNTLNRSVQSTAAQRHIIVFTRFPEPGKTKTRLIPALGPEGAASLQQTMTEHTLATVHQLQREFSFRQESISVDVRFAGGTAALMKQWLGLNWIYTSQGEGDLGDRLLRAFQQAFEQGAKAVLAIGIDCPDITVDILTEAFQKLSTTDMVIGPADDGGYYLIGLSALISDCFQGIEWGTETVRQATLAKATQLTLKVAELQILSDVDRPNDIVIWERAFAKSLLNRKPLLSIIIPTLNEGHRISELLETLTKNQDLEAEVVEIIVIDGGSTDNTVETACAWHVRVLSSPPGRARQMNTAAQVAKGDTLLFLHADTVLPKTFYSAIANTLAQSNVIAGAFELSIQGQNPTLRLVEWGVKWRSHLFQMPYGDQGLFIKRDVFETLGGFADIPIMEDFELIQRLKRRGKVAIAPVSVRTSGRRWNNLGVWKTTVINQAVIIGYLCGVEPARLANWYRGNMHKPEQNRNILQRNK